MHNRQFIMSIMSIKDNPISAFFCTTMILISYLHPEILKSNYNFREHTWWLPIGGARHFLTVEASSLIMGNKTLKVYVEQKVLLPFYSPFPNLAIIMPATKTHMKKVNAWMRRYSFGDCDHISIPTTDLMLKS